MNRIFGFLCFFPFMASAQTFSGVIIDESTKEVVPFVHVSMKNSSIGTISNAEGFFNLSFTITHSNDTLVFTHISFNPKKISLPSLKSDYIDTVILSQRVNTLTEITVSNISTFDYFQNVLKKTIGKLTQDYSTQIYYRELHSENNQPIQFADAILTIAYKKSKLDSDIGVNQSRIVKTPMADKSIIKSMYPVDIKNVLNTQNLIFLKQFINNKEDYIFAVSNNRENFLEETFDITLKKEIDRKHLLFNAKVIVNNGYITNAEISLIPNCTWGFSFMGQSASINEYKHVVNFMTINDYMVISSGFLLVDMNIISKKDKNTIKLRSEYVIIDSNSKKEAINKENRLKTKSIAQHGSEYNTQFWKDKNIPLTDSTVVKIINRANKN